VMVRMKDAISTLLDQKKADLSVLACRCGR
jgi:hypothetical protein